MEKNQDEICEKSQAEKLNDAVTEFMVRIYDTEDIMRGSDDGADGFALEMAHDQNGRLEFIAVIPCDRVGNNMIPRHTFSPKQNNLIIH